MTEQDNNSKPSLGKDIFLPAFSGCGLGCLGVMLIGTLLMALGFAMFLVDASVLGGFAGFVVVLTTAIVVRRKGKRPPWRLFLAEVATVVLVILAFVAWDAPRAVFQSVFCSPVPSSVKILHAQYDEHPMDPSAWIHFSSSPQDLRLMIESNQLSLRPGADPVGTGGNIKPKWWSPVELGPCPTLFDKQVHSDNNTSYVTYVVGVWVNAETNEAYGYYIDF